jgi:CheY-like chemotaxis protein
MPQMNGYEVAQRLRSDQKFTGRLVALTGYGRDYDREQARSAGFDHHLVKPVDYAVLEELLRTVASSKFQPEEVSPEPSPQAGMASLALSNQAS